MLGRINVLKRAYAVIPRQIRISPDLAENVVPSIGRPRFNCLCLEIHAHFARVREDFSAEPIPATALI